MAHGIPHVHPGDSNLPQLCQVHSVRICSYQSSESYSKLLTKYSQKNQYAQQFASNWPCLCVVAVLCGEVWAEPSVHTVPRGAVPACHYRGY